MDGSQVTACGYITPDGWSGKWSSRVRDVRCRGLNGAEFRSGGRAHAQPHPYQELPYLLIKPVFVTAQTEYSCAAKVHRGLSKV